MHIEAQKFTVEMTHNELWSTAWDIKNALEHTIKTHWVNHQHAWKSHEENRLNRLSYMFLSLGRPELYDAVYKFADETFKEFNSAEEKRAKTNKQ